MSGEGGRSRLYSWDGRDRPRAVPAVDLTGFNAEAFFTAEDRNDIFLFSDDGSLPVAGARCKDLPDPAQKRFRGLRFRASGRLDPRRSPLTAVRSARARRRM